MKRLLKAYKNLPREFKMALGLLGLGTPIGAIYLLKRYFFPGVGTHILIICVVLVIAALFLIGFLVSKLFGMASGKRRRRMQTDLADESQAGPATMDAREAIRQNNAKFFTAVRDMRRNLGVSPYDLPWYIVIGDSGCGKTKLINESGLMFSAGKPEGYQLGTLNYNWWFTEDAVFLDMAGRLVNPQEDADRREWEGFLNSISKGRKGFPINGAIVCISAEHLLEDSPDKHEDDANTILERLRDLQTKLGVTFATYLVITKCDKILGFMQFFDRADRDVAVRNQMFGWSKPGSFNELYDPERFDREFDALYDRLNELRLRRLNDDADEITLGLAHSFPEEFNRGLRDPLRTYVRTLFPMIRNPRAVKNLLFRGLYFTSATQKGSVILRRLCERLGDQAAHQIPTLESLYPRPRPLFVNHLLIKKVFPEHGLVFRNEQDVIRNRKLSRLLKIGTGVAAAVLVAALVWSARAFGKAVIEPREHVTSASDRLVKGEYLSSPSAALEDYPALEQDVQTIKKSKWEMRVLSLGILGLPYDPPTRHVRAIQIRVFEEGLLRPVLRDVDQALSNPRITLRHSEASQPERILVDVGTYMDALVEYVRWHVCSMHGGSPHVDEASLRKLCAIVDDHTTPDSFLQRGDNRERLLSSAAEYFSLIKDRSDDRSDAEAANPASLLARGDIKPVSTIETGLRRIREHFEEASRIAADSYNPTIREWMRIDAACNQVMESYNAILHQQDTRVVSSSDLLNAARTIRTQWNELDRSLKECVWTLDTAKRIASLAEEIAGIRARWKEYERRLGEACDSCPARGAVQNESVDGLKKMFVKNSNDLDEALLQGLSALYVGTGSLPLIMLDDLKHAAWSTIEIYERHRHMISYVRAQTDGPWDPNAPQSDSVTLTADAKKSRQRLDDLQKNLPQSVDPDKSSYTTLEAWSLLLYQHLESGQSHTGAKADPAGLPENEKWSPARLGNLEDWVNGFSSKLRGTVLLLTLKQQLGVIAQDPRGLAALIPSDEVRREEPRNETESTPTIGPERREERPAPREPRHDTAATDTAADLNHRVQEYFVAAWALTRFKAETHYIPDADSGGPLPEDCRKLLDSALERYCAHYVSGVADRYAQASIPDLEHLVKQDIRTWADLTAEVNRSKDTIRDELRRHLHDHLRDIPWADWIETQNATLKSWDRGAGTLRGDWQTINNNLRREFNDATLEAIWRVIIDSLDKPMSGDRGLSGILKAKVAQTAPRYEKAPWDQVADGFGAYWGSVANTVETVQARFESIDKRASAAQKTPRFDKDTGATPIPGINWAELAGLREEYGLQDEARLTGPLAEFNIKAQQLLSLKLSDMLVQIEKDRLGTAARVYDGWPYLVSDRNRTETLKLGEFRDFLIEVYWAERALADLEKSLPVDDRLKIRRNEFHEACRRWRMFLMPDFDGREEGYRLKPLELKARYAEGFGARIPGEASLTVNGDEKNFYYYKQLSMGDISLRFETGKDPQDQELTWTWSEQGQAGRPITFSWEEPKPLIGLRIEGHFPPMNPIPLGESSPLAICAYLHHYRVGGSDENRSIQVLHWVKVREGWRQAGAADNLLTALGVDDKTIIGSLFVFELRDRALPAPIRPIHDGS